MQASILENFHSLFWPIVSELICPVLTRNLTLCPFLRFDLDLKTCSWNSCPEQQHHPSSTAYTCVQEPPLLVFLQSAGKRNWERIPGKTDFRTNLSCSWALTYGTDPSIPNYSYHITRVLPTLQKHSPALYSSTSQHWSIKQGLSVIPCTWKFITIKGSCLYVCGFFLQKMTP